MDEIVPSLFPLVNFLLILAYLAYFMLHNRGVSSKRFELMEFRLDRCFQDKVELRSNIAGLERKISDLNKEIEDYRRELNRDFWEREKESLEKSHQLISDLINEYRTQLSLETRPEEKIRIRQALEKTEAERQNLETDIDCIGRQLDG